MGNYNLKRAYWVSACDGEYGVTIIAKNAREAKITGSYSYHLPWDEWIELKVKWIKNVKKDILDKLEYGEVGFKIGFKLGLYGWPDVKCKQCKKDITSDDFKENESGGYLCKFCGGVIDYERG
jgi:hypothetical protein